MAAIRFASSARVGSSSSWKDRVQTRAGWRRIGRRSLAGDPIGRGGGPLHYDDGCYRERLDCNMDIVDLD